MIRVRIQFKLELFVIDTISFENNKKKLLFIIFDVNVKRNQSTYDYKYTRYTLNFSSWLAI